MSCPELETAAASCPSTGPRPSSTILSWCIYLHFTLSHCSYTLLKYCFTSLNLQICLHFTLLHFTYRYAYILHRLLKYTKLICLTYETFTYTLLTFSYLRSIIQMKPTLALSELILFTLELKHQCLPALLCYRSLDRGTIKHN